MKKFLRVLWFFFLDYFLMVRFYRVLEFGFFCGVRENRVYFDFVFISLLIMCIFIKNRGLFERLYVKKILYFYFIRDKI